MFGDTPRGRSEARPPVPKLQRRTDTPGVPHGQHPELPNSDRIDYGILLPFEVMAANYWASTQRKNWLFSREKLAETRRALDLNDRAAVTQFPLPDLRILSIYINQREFLLYNHSGLAQLLTVL